MTVAAVVQAADLRINPDLGSRWALSTGNACLAEDLICALSSDEGSLVYAPGWGFNVMRQVNGTFSRADIASLNSRISAQCLRNPKVQSASVSTVFNASTNSLTITMQIEPADGPFTLVLLVTQLSVAVLNAQQLGIPSTTPAASATPTLQGPPGAAGTPGATGPASTVPGPPGPGGNSTQSFGAGDEVNDASGSEVVLWQFTLNASNHPGGTLTANFSLQAKSPGGTATFKLYVGGSFVARFQAPGGGTAIGSPQTNASSSYTTLTLSGTFTNPTGVVPVQVTMESPAPTVAAFAKEVDGTITP